MLPDDTLVETSHGEMTVKSIRENDLPYWLDVMNNAKRVYNIYCDLIEVDGETK